MPLHPPLFPLSLFLSLLLTRVITFPLGVRCAWLQTCLVKNLPSVSIFLCETSYCWIMHETCSHYISFSLSLSHPVGWGNRSDSSGRDGHPFPSSPCFCSHQLHCPLLTKWAYLTPHPVAQMNNSPRCCTAGEAQAGLHLTERGQWIMGLRRGSPLPACPRERTSKLQLGPLKPGFGRNNAAGTIARILYGKKQI